jgi:hypothetical protein
VAGWYDSPYPPTKLVAARDTNHPIAIKGASLTAVDAIRTFAHKHGTFTKHENGRVPTYERNADSAEFKMVLHSRRGLLPAVRIALEDPDLHEVELISDEEIAANMAANDGFASLDYVFEKCFKERMRDKDPQLYARMRDWTVEQFVDATLPAREHYDAFALLVAEYDEAEKLMKRQQPIYWKELLAALRWRRVCLRA